MARKALPLIRVSHLWKPPIPNEALSPTERAEVFLKTGYLLYYSYGIFNGYVYIQPSDIQIPWQQGGRVQLPAHGTSIKVMSDAYIRKMGLYKRRIRDYINKYTNKINFGTHLVAPWIPIEMTTILSVRLDEVGTLIQKEGQAISKNYDEYVNKAKKILGRESGPLWRLVSHFFGKTHVLTPPKEWKQHFVNIVSTLRFPSKRKLWYNHLRYKFYYPHSVTPPYQGKLLYQETDYVKRTGNVSKALIRYRKDALKKIQSRIKQLQHAYDTSTREGATTLVAYNTIFQAKQDLATFSLAVPFNDPKVQTLRQCLIDYENWLEDATNRKVAFEPDFRKEAVDILMTFQKELVNKEEMLTQAIYDVYGDPKDVARTAWQKIAATRLFGKRSSDAIENNNRMSGI